MTISETEKESMRLRAWANRAKGKGVRWRMIRDTMSVISVHWMTSSEVEICMVKIWGLTRKKTREILDEMTEIGDCIVEKDEKTSEMKYHLKQERVNFWLGKGGIHGIPAGIVEVVETTMHVKRLEAEV